MAMRIYNNTQAINAQKNLATANSQVGKTLEKLSSGLRINRASDDASGLAISEKLRGQIRGLKRASMNAQDGISFLQTAEGGLNEVSSIIQRMRELAVQAGNGTYTTNDRKELQKEVDQLKDEINRISAATEFNTKKLLNGDATALWSADSDSIDVVVNGPVVEGNYRINIDAEPGKNYVYNTDVMTLKSGVVGAEIITEGTNVELVSDPKTLQATGTSYYTVTIGDTNTAAGTATGLAATYAQAGSSWVVGTQTGSAAYTASGYIEVTFTSTGSANVTLSAKFISAKTGEITDLGTSTAGSGGMTLDIDAKVVDGVALGADFTANMTLSSGGQIQKGDKILFTVSQNASVTSNAADSGGGTIQLSGGPDSVSGPVLKYSGDSALTLKDDSDSTLDYNAVTIYAASLNADTGNLDVGEMTLEFKEQTNTAATQGLTTTGTFTVKISGGGEAAASTSRLKDLAGFTNDDGRNILDVSQELKIFGNGKEATIFIEGDDTINELEQKITTALVDQLGMGATKDTSTAYSTLNSQLVNYVAKGEETSNTNESTAGSFVIQTAFIGDNSKLSFVGDQALIDALGLNVLQEGENAELTVEITNAIDGSNVGNEVVSDYTLRGAIQGVEISVNPDVAISASWDDTNKEISFTSGAAEDVYLHLKDNRTQIQIGANEGQTIDVSVAQVNAKSLGIASITLVDMESSQKAISLLDSALAEVASTRATIGAQISRMESTIVNLETARENLSASESRIRDLDIAEETSKFTRNQILVQASTAMLAQANQLPQMALQLLG